MNEPMRLSASGSPLAKQLLLAARRERPRTEAKLEAIAAAVLVGTRRPWYAAFFAKPWVVGLSLLALGLGVGAASICTLAAPSGPALETEPVDRGEPASTLFEVRPRVPESFALAREPAAPRVQPAPAQPPVEAPPRPIAAPPTELDLLRGARLSLVNGDAARALATLDEHARLYPTGTLLEEAAALRVEVLTRSDAAAARAAAARFARQYPNSPYAERLRSVVAGLPRQ